MIAIENVTKKFSTKQVFENLSFEINKGEVCGLVGLNGAGKTTLLRIICGMLTSDTGTVSVFGNPPSKDGTFYRRMGVVLESDGFNGNLTFRENLQFFASAKQVDPREIEPYIDTFWQNIASKEQPVKQFSRGERMQCSLARAFLGKPELLLLDEPASNLDMDGYKRLCHLVRYAQERGATTIISSHRLDAISDLCETALFLNDEGIQKHSLSNDYEIEWVLRGENAQKAALTISENNGVVVCSENEEIQFSGLGKEDVSRLVPEFIDSGVVLWELFKKDRVTSVLEQM